MERELDNFVARPVSQAYLDAMTTCFAAVRLPYTNQLHFALNTTWPPVPPYDDASKAQMLDHLIQLAPSCKPTATWPLCSGPVSSALGMSGVTPNTS